MENVYSDVEKRTGGDIYIGVVGPVRTGKSTFIKKFMETLVLPFYPGEEGARIRDSLPQSAEGKTVMTTEPKFVPSKATEISLGGKANAVARVRLIDCVGFPVVGASGFEEEGAPRLVKTPWSDDAIPFERASELGTEKVITEHSTIGILMTTDGSFTDIPRANYIPAEERTVNELKRIKKPFIILVNSSHPDAIETKKLARELEEKYSNTAMAVNCENLGEEDFKAVLGKALFEFPVKCVNFSLPEWMRVLPETSEIISDVLNSLKKFSLGVGKMNDCIGFEKCFSDSEYIRGEITLNMDLGEGTVNIELAAREGVFYRILGKECSADLSSERKLMNYVLELSEAKREYDKIKKAFSEARQNGYGIVPPDNEELLLSKPEPIRRGSDFGVKIRATAPCYHILKVEVSNEIAPSMGSEERSEEFLKELLSHYDDEPEKLWETEVFGKSLKELMNLGMSGKTLPDGARKKMVRAISKIVNDGKGNLICIVF